MASTCGLARVETSGAPGRHHLPPPGSWPGTRAPPPRWRGGGSPMVTAPPVASRLTLGRPTLRWTSPSGGSHQNGEPLGSSGGPSGHPLGGAPRADRSSAEINSMATAWGLAANAAAASEEWLSHLRDGNGTGNGRFSGPSDGVSSADDSPSVEGENFRQRSNAREVSPGSVRDLLKSTLNAIDVLQSPYKVTESFDEDSMHDDALFEHGPSSMGRAVYEVLRIDHYAKQRRIYVKRRDLLRSNGLLPRDLRRIDPSLSMTKTSPSISIKEHVLLVNLGGVRTIIAADKCLLFEPSSPCSRKFLNLVTPRLAASESLRISQAYRAAHPSSEDADYAQENPPPPFELEMVEGALMVATGRLEAELLSITKRVSDVLRMLPKDITPVNLEELRRVKQVLVELESKADTLRDMLEQLMDDEDEIRDMNLSSRPHREDRRKQRERERLAREMERGDEQRARASADSGMSTLEWSSSSSWEKQEKISRRTFDGDEGRAEAESALEEMEEAEAEEREAEEVEDLLEYYMQRAASTQSEAERLLAGARDLEESIGVSLSARRFEVNRLELTLSIGSFAAALGAVVAGIFGMNLRSTCEESIVGFWGCTGAIIIGCIWVFVAIYKYMRRRRIL